MSLPCSTARRRWQGLRAVVSSFAALPGRKSIVYYTENLPITDRMKPKFDALIGEANRANITVYPVNPAGLCVHSKEAELGRNVAVAGAKGIGDQNRGEGAWTKELEKEERCYRPGRPRCSDDSRKRPADFHREHERSRRRRRRRAHAAGADDVLLARIRAHERQARWHVPQSEREGEKIQGDGPRAGRISRSARVIAKDVSLRFLRITLREGSPT